MKQLLIILLASVMLSFISCDKSSSLTVVKGKVVQQETLLPVSNAMVIFSQSYSKGLLQGIVEWEIDTAYTDQAGEFTWETDINPRNETYNTVGAFSIEKIVAENYYNTLSAEVGRQGNQTRYSYLEQQNIEVEMVPHAYLDVNLINAQVPSTNYFKLFTPLSDVRVEEFGESSQSSFIISGSQFVVYKYTTDQNLNDWNIDSFYLGAFNTKTLDFIY